MKLSSESKLFLGIGLFTGIVIFIATIAFSKPPKPIAKETLITTTTHTIGNKESATWLVEFSDFQCPACHAFAGVVEDLTKKYPDTLLVAYRHYPLPMHPEAKGAALAAEAAGAQNKFFEMGTLLFDNQASLSATLYPELAQALNLDQGAFTKAYEDEGLKDKIENDRRFGDSIGISATPTFYLNGVKLELRTVEDLRKKVEEAIRSSK